METVFGAPIFNLSTCESTNAYAKDWLQGGRSVIEGTVFKTLNQTAGRGQGGTGWIAEPGKCLTFSVVLEPHFLGAHEAWWLNAITSLSVLYALSELRPPLQEKIHIKWPNDLMLADKKICGILTETILMGSQLKYAIVGIGLNINQDEIPLPHAGSLKSIEGREYDIEQVFDQVLFSLKNHYDLLRITSRKALKAAYEDSLYKRDISTEFVLPDGSGFTGKITGIDAHGQLHISTGPGQLRTFGVKDLRMLYGS